MSGIKYLTYFMIDSERVRVDLTPTEMNDFITDVAHEYISDGEITSSMPYSIWKSQPGKANVSVYKNFCEKVNEVSGTQIFIFQEEPHTYSI